MTTESGAPHRNNNRGHRGKGKWRNNNNRKANKNQGGGNRSSNPVQQYYASTSVPTGTASGNTVFAGSSIQCSSPSRTNIVSACNDSFGRILGSHSNTVC